MSNTFFLGTRVKGLKVPVSKTFLIRTNMDFVPSTTFVVYYVFDLVFFPNLHGNMHFSIKMLIYRNIFVTKYNFLGSVKRFSEYVFLLRIKC